MKSPLLRKHENTVESRVESLLSLLRNQMRHDPPPELRERLARLSNQHMGAAQALAESRYKAPFRIRRFVLSTAAAIGCVLLTGFLAEMLLHKPYSHDQIMHAVVTPHATPASSTDRQPAMSSVASLSATQSAASTSEGQREDRLVIPLPYSDHAVATGVSSTVPVSVSQAELLALGVPVEPGLRDRRFVAELILGSDGLPRALSVPLPLAPVEDMQ